MLALDSGYSGTAEIKGKGLSRDRSKLLTSYINIINTQNPLQTSYSVSLRHDMNHEPWKLGNTMCTNGMNYWIEVVIIWSIYKVLGRWCWGNGYFTGRTLTEWGICIYIASQLFPSNPDWHSNNGMQRIISACIFMNLETSHNMDTMLYFIFHPKCSMAYYWCTINVPVAFVRYAAMWVKILPGNNVFSDGTKP